MMYSGVVIIKVKPLRVSPFVVIINWLRLTTPQIYYYFNWYLLKRNTNTGEAGVCWAKVVRPCIYELRKIK